MIHEGASTRSARKIEVRNGVETESRRDHIARDESWRVRQRQKGGERQDDGRERERERHEREETKEDETYSVER